MINFQLLLDNKNNNKIKNLNKVFDRTYPAPRSIELHKPNRLTVQHFDFKLRSASERFNIIFRKVDSIKAKGGYCLEAEDDEGK